MSLQTGSPIVTLRSIPGLPFDGAIAAARTCYSPRVVGVNEVTEKQRQTIGSLTFDGGHHTVYQHANFEFGLENVSRQFVWSFLHSYPFYNSEQSSQRYVKLNEPRAFVPPVSGQALDVYEQAILRAWDHYAALSTLLKDDTFRILKELRHVLPQSSPERVQAIGRDAEKKAIETARYVIPIAAFTSMVHTISGITLHRLRRMMRSGDAPHETQLIVSAMVDLVSEHDPAFFSRVGLDALDGQALPESGFPRTIEGGDEFARRFDGRLNGRVSRLVDWSAQGEEIVATSVRDTFGLDAEELPTDEALDRVMNPARNRLRLDTLNVTYHSPLMRSLHHTTYTFEKRLSHTADSQDQRHRMVPASRPMMTWVDTQAPDYVTPMLIERNPHARQVFREAMADAWQAKNRLLELGVPLEFALYVLPNAKALRLVESGPLIALLHKWTMRTCFNAQEEIYRASMDEVEQVAACHPRLARFIGPPCVIRNGLVSPRCTEGTHFCGVPVWLGFPKVERRL
ncbi:MAG: FAD-dependent thymidylate synthase [Acidobacteria bacterium]|nr:FAD-dependent thymidylate synthase [Acidobacteriota bacterium]